MRNPAKPGGVEIRENTRVGPKETITDGTKAAKPVGTGDTIEAIGGEAVASPIGNT